MGANYDIIVARCAQSDRISATITDLLLKKGLRVASVLPLSSVEIDDDMAVLLSQPTIQGWTAVVTTSPLLGGGSSPWFDRNTIAIRLSSDASVTGCIHFWSLDSGYVVGYGLYEDGMNVETECVFSNAAQSHDLLMAGVPTPKRRSGHRLAELLGLTRDFCSVVSSFRNLEIGLASIISRCGVSASLIDVHEAVDEKKAIAVMDGKHTYVDLTGWTAILFQR
ncbi:MAG TPA: hypothetical protein VGI81_10680 [Tepidisphaeraceae bacterium]